MNKTASPKKPPAKQTKSASPSDDRPVEVRAQEVVAWLKQSGSKAVRDGMARYALPSDKAFGISMSNLQGLAKRLGKDHELAAALWATGLYEARMVAAYVDEPEKVTAAQMDRWARDFDNWGHCDTLCFALFDRTPHAWAKVDQWAVKKDEFVRRAAFALLASLVAHDKQAADAQFLHGLSLIEDGAQDERNFVKKGVNWALRCIGKRNAALNKAAVSLAQRLAASKDPAPRWVGKDALRELTSAAVLARLAAKRERASKVAAAQKRAPTD
jgi:3-methyladenine DNA glycosylase AlkD